MANYSFKYPLLNDRTWLYQQYVLEKKSTIEIASLAGAKTANSARQALLRNNIKVRTVGEGLTCDREDEGFVLDKEVIEGCLLGDGFLRKWNPGSDNSYPYFKKRNKYYDHVLYVAKQVFPHTYQDKVKEHCEKHDGSDYTVFSMNSLSHKELLPFYKKWYPGDNDFQKVVPEDIEITNKVLLHWFLDDGCSWIRRDRNNAVVIVLCSESFVKNDQERLCSCISKEFGLRCKVGKCQFGTGYRIYISQSQTKGFYDIIGEPPVASLAYKWKIKC